MLYLTSVEEAVIFGAILGDSYLQKTDASYRISFAHAIRHEDYLLWKYKKLKRLCIRENFKLRFNKRSSGDGLYYFYLLSNREYKFYHYLMYKPYTKNNKVYYKKIITQELIDYMPANPLLLAVWFMDDGSIRNNSFSGKLSTQCFTFNEQVLLQKFLISKFSIKTNIVVSNRLKNQYYLAIPFKSFGPFVDLIKPYINEIPSMRYKIKNPLLFK